MEQFKLMYLTIFIFILYFKTKPSYITVNINSLVNIDTGHVFSCNSLNHKECTDAVYKLHFPQDNE